MLIRKHWTICLNKRLQRLDIGEFRGDKLRENHTEGKREGGRERGRERGREGKRETEGERGRVGNIVITQI